jgi:hypothetical protein
MREVVRTMASLAAGACIATALYWVFLNTPESRVLLLVLSGLLVLAILVTAGVAIVSSMLIAGGDTWARSLNRGVRALPSFAVVAAIAALIVWGIGRADIWIGAQFGQVSAWFIARFNVDDVRWLFTVERYVSLWLRCVVVPLGALALLHAVVTGGAAGAVPGRWLRAGWHWRTLLVATAAFLIVVVLPGQWVTWRPALVEGRSFEPAFAGARLAFIAGLALAGAAVVLRTLVGKTRAR